MSRIAATLQAFFTDRLITQRNSSPETIASYRDTMRLLLAYAREQTGKQPFQLDFDDLDAALIGAFLTHLETERGNSSRTRNNRLAAIHSFFRYAALEHPEHAQTIARVMAIPAKRYQRKDICYLDRAEITALLTVPDRTRWHGRRDHALLLTLIQTGLRVSELTRLRVRDVNLGTAAHVQVTGKGRKRRLPARPAGSCTSGSTNAKASPRTRCSRPAKAQHSAATPSSSSLPSTPPSRRPAARP